MIQEKDYCYKMAQQQKNETVSMQLNKYNNTFVGTVSAAGYDPDVSAWYQPNNGAQRAYGFRNNLHVYRGNGNMLWLESTGHDPIDWTHNSWFPNSQIQWPDGVYSNLGAAQNGLPNTAPMNALTEVTGTYTPTLAGGTAPKNSGAVIPNITDGFTGTSPDRGALISGRDLPAWGDRGDQDSVPPPPDLVPPSASTNLEVN